LYYAKELFSLLSKAKWHFRLSYSTPLKLTAKKVGSKTRKTKEYFRSLYKEVLGVALEQVPSIEDTAFKLKTVEKVLDYLQIYLENQSIDKGIVSFYERKPEWGSEKNSKEARYTAGSQLSFDVLQSEKNPYVNKLVQDAIYVTPPEYARDMAKCALDAFGSDSRKIDFGDSAIGTGALFLALKKWVDIVNETQNSKYEFNSAIGVDIDKMMAQESFIRYSKRGLAVIYGDAILPNTDLGLARNLMLVNPPYNRHENIPKGYQQRINAFAEKQTGIKILGDAGLYVYHLLIMDKWLGENGVAAWLIPSIFLQSRYGRAVREYLLNNVQMVQLHVYDEEKLQFDNTHISTTIVTFEKKSKVDSANIRISYGDSVMKPLSVFEARSADFEDSLENWRKIIYRTCTSQHKIGISPKIIRFDELFDIKRGLATGANSFFVLDRKKAEQIMIPNFALKPILPKARYLNSLIINAQEDGFPDVSPQLVLIDCDINEKIISQKHPNFFAYLEMAKQKDDDGKSIVDRALVRGRRPWYKQEKREAPPFLLTYMGRKKSKLPPLYFILNRSEATALNTYILLYPKPWLDKLLKEDMSLYENLLSSLNQTAKQIISQQTRIYAGGLQKLEPGELKGLSLIDIPSKIAQAFEHNKNDFGGFFHSQG